MRVAGRKKVCTFSSPETTWCSLIDSNFKILWRAARTNFFLTCLHLRCIEPQIYASQSCIIAESVAKKPSAHAFSWRKSEYKLHPPTHKMNSNRYEGLPLVLLINKTLLLYSGDTTSLFFFASCCSFYCIVWHLGCCLLLWTVFNLW